ncbi:hypothetical protein HMPREF0240_02171 [Clostridium sp. D5]|nr:hypothetical protein HMPREF0240_02171 [Clostridium sp. D5]
MCQETGGALQTLFVNTRGGGQVPEGFQGVCDYGIISTVEYKLIQLEHKGEKWL